MLVTLLIIIAAMLILACVFGRKINSINEIVDDVFHKLLKQEGEIIDHKSRLDAYIKNIASNQKRIDDVDTALYDFVSKRNINNAYSEEERKQAEKYIIAHYCELSNRAIARELGISATTINRWTKKLKESGRL